MWTPRPVSPLRYAGSVATSVLPSPVAISAILPSWSTMPPMSCTSKWRIRTVRRAAWRQTANASARSSSTGSPSAMRCRNSSDFARSPASSSACTAGSSALIACTAGIIRLTSRSCLVPKIVLSRVSIISVDYGTRECPRAISPAADARVHLVEDHRGHAVRPGEHRLEGEHRARELTAGGHARQRAQLLARVRREPELRAVEAARRDFLQDTALERDSEDRALHSERAQLALGLRPKALARRAAPVRKRAGSLGELGLELGQQALLRVQDLLVPREAIELGGDLVAEREHRRLRVTVLAPEIGR